MTCTRYDDDLYIDTTCWHQAHHSAPDGRCKTGVREWSVRCGHVFSPWYTIRELVEIVSAHIKEKHPG